MELILKNIEKKIYTIRERQVMLDSDLAVLYNTETKWINRAIKRNPSRFPQEFAFQLTQSEWDNLRFQFGTSSLLHGGRRYLPIVFTEQGVAMLSAVLQTDIAVQVSVHIMNAFVAMRKSIGQLHALLQRMDGLELKQLQTDKQLEKIFTALENKAEKKQGIFFEGQLFDAHVFASKLVREAHQSIILVDNYVDETTLQLLSKRKKGVACYIHTRINTSLKSDIIKHNRQYPEIILLENRKSHDRFLIIDSKKLFHFGASLKDLGNKCFAFSRMDELLPEIREHLLKE